MKLRDIKKIVIEFEDNEEASKYVDYSDPNNIILNTELLKKHIQHFHVLRILNLIEYDGYNQQLILECIVKI